MATPGNIDQLNFEVILKDNQFKNDLANLQKLAEAFNLTMTQALTVAKSVGGSTSNGIKTLSSALASASKNAQELKKSLNEIPNKKIVDFSSNVRGTNSQMNTMSGLLRGISQLTGVAFGVAGLRRFLSSLIEITGQFEVQKMALGSMLQDADKADKIFREYRQLALESPYTFMDFSKFGKQLTAFNIPANELVGTTKMLADIAAGLGVSMDRIILAYGQIKSAGVLKGTELRQLTEAGVPILDALAKKIEETTGRTVQLAEVFDMISKKQIPFQMVDEAFKEMTSEGGKFYNMQEVLVETLSGKIGKLRDTWQQALYDIGSSQSGLLKGSVDFVTNLVSNYDKLGHALKEIVVYYGAYRAALAVATLASKGYTAAEIVQVTWMGIATKAQKLLNATILKNPYAILAAAIIGTVVALERLIRAQNNQIKAQKVINQTTTDYNSEVRSEQENLRVLIERMKLLNPQTEKYNELKERLMGKYGQYLSDVDREKIAVGNLAGIYDRLSVSIQSAAKQKYIMKGYDDLENELGSMISKIQNDFKKKYRKLPGEVQENLLDYIFGNIDEGGLTADAQKAFGYINLLTGQADNAINQWRNDYSNAVAEVERGQKELERVFGKKVTVDDGADWPPRPTDWQTKVSKTLYGREDELRKQYMFKPDESWETYYTRMKGEYDDVNNRIAHAYNESDKKMYQNRKKFLQALDKEFGGALLAGSKSMRSEASTAAKEENEEVRGIRARIETLRKYMDTYKDFEELVGPDFAKSLTDAAYKDVKITDFNFLGQIDAELQKLEALGKKDVADSIRAAMGFSEGKDELAQLKRVQNTANAYKELIRSMTSEDTDVEGKGFWYDISKVASDLETKLNKLSLQGQKAKEKLAGIDVNNENQKAAIFKALSDEGWEQDEIQDFWDKWLSGGTSAVDAFVRDMSKKLSDASRERVTELAKGYVEDEFFLQGIDFDNLSDRTIGQLRTLKKKLHSVLAGIKINDADQNILDSVGIDLGNLKGIDLDDILTNDWLQLLDESTVKTLKLMQAVQKADGSFEDFGNVVEKIVSGKLKDLTDEEKKQIVNIGKFAVSSFSSVANALKELGDSSGNDTLSSLAESFEELSGIAENVMQGFAQGGPMGAAIAAVTSIATGLIKAASESAKFKAELAEAREEARGLRFEMNLSEGVDSIFGTNGVRNIQNAVAGIKEAEKAMRDLGSRGTFKNRQNFWSVGFGVGEGGKQFSLQEMADSLGRELYDSYGNLNAETLQEILDKYDKLKSADRAWIEQAITNSENYTKAMEHLDKAVEDILGNVVASATASIVDNWKKAGDAALDYADIMDDVATKFAEMAVESALLSTVFDEKKKEEFKALIAKGTDTGDYTPAMALLNSSLEEVRKMLPALQEQVLDPLLGYISDAQETSNTLSSGISKELVERNSTLLASYINAIRADVSVTRNDIHTYLPVIASNLSLLTVNDSPSLAEYQAEVQARLADISQTNAAIAQDMSDFVFRFKSVVATASSGGSAIRTTK